jgi:hypothetical protein
LIDQQVAHLAKYFDECPKNPPQDIPVTPLHVQHIAQEKYDFVQQARPAAGNRL